MAWLPSYFLKQAASDTNTDYILNVSSNFDAGSRLGPHVYIPFNSSSPEGLIDADTVDPWSRSGKYALGWVYFSIVLLVLSVCIRVYYLWTDKMRVAWHKEQQQANVAVSTPQSTSILLRSMPSNLEAEKAETSPEPEITKPTNVRRSTRAFNIILALFRYIFYRPIPDIPLRKGWRPIVFPSLSAAFITASALVFVTLYCFIPRPLYWEDISYGSPPLAIRAGMIAVAIMPWLVALSTKANIISLITGFGHGRLNVLHRWAGWLCLFLSLLHTTPFYVTPIWENSESEVVFSSFFGQGIYVYGSGIAALVPLIFLCVHSLPWLRHQAYELFIKLHIPVSVVFLATLFWHCNNYLTSWSYLWATTAIWSFAYLLRILFYLNWTNPWRLAWLYGDEALISILSENAIKITIATRIRWKPGQHIYLRLPGVSPFSSRPFTITSLCHPSFPSAISSDPGYRDLNLVFRSFAGFTASVLKEAQQQGPVHAYRAFLDGPYGGPTRPLDSFDHVLLIAGGSGITALTSHLLHLVQRMRQGKAVTKTIQVVWAMKRPEVMSWFREELRICREHAPAGSVKCHFYITAAKRLPRTGQLVSANTPSRIIGDFFSNKVNSLFRDVAGNTAPTRQSCASAHSAAHREEFIQHEAAGNAERERQLRQENEDTIAPLPQAHLHPGSGPPTTTSIQHKRRAAKQLSLDISAATQPYSQNIMPAGVAVPSTPPSFGFPSTPTEFAKSIVRLAFQPARTSEGWSTEYGRPDIPYMLRKMSEEFGERTAVFVCGPPEMRVDVARGVAALQRTVWEERNREELWLWTENYAS